MESPDTRIVDAPMAVNKRLLALSWFMPPLVAPRALQVSRTLKSLADRGWDCTVATIDSTSVSEQRDTRLFDIYADSYKSLYIPIEEAPFLHRLRRKIFRYRRYAHDYQKFYFLDAATDLLLQRLKNGTGDILISFAQPWIDHVVALKVKRKFSSIPWLAHFSDPWTDSPYAKPNHASHDDSDIELERAVIEAADAVVFVSDETAELVMRKYPQEWQSKVHVIPHICDADLLKYIQPTPRPDNRLYIVHTGNFYGMRMPTDFLHALARLNETHGARNSVVADFIGYIPDESRALVEELSLFGQVHFLGPASYFSSLGATAAADVLLLIDAPADTSVFLPSKIVDYFLLDKPILGLTPHNGASARVLMASGHHVAPPNDQEAIYKLLVMILEDWRRGNLRSHLKRGRITTFDPDINASLFEAAIIAAQQRVASSVQSGTIAESD